MNSNGRISAPVTTTDVSQVLGISTHNIGRQIAMAKEGGEDVTLEDGTRFKTAFKLKQNGHTLLNQGQIIKGAKPYWNIWSTFSPGLLQAPLSATTNVASLICQLDNKIDGVTPVTGQGYCFRLGGFNGYDHNAVAPTVEITAKAVNINDSQTAIEVDFYKGDYDWLLALNSATYDNVGLWLYITNHRTGELIASVGTDPVTSVDTGLEGKIRGSAIIDKPFYTLDMDIDVGVASFTFHPGNANQPAYWELNKALMTGWLLGVTHINNVADRNTYATFEWRNSPYIEDANITVTKQVNQGSNYGGIKISGGFIWPPTTQDGQPNSVPQIGSYLRFRVIDLITSTIVYEGSDSFVTPPIDPSNEAVRFSTSAVNYPYQQYNLKIELWFASDL